MAPREPYIVQTAEEVAKIAERANRIVPMASAMVVRLLQSNGVSSGRLLEISSGTGALTAELAGSFPDLRITTVEKSDALAGYATNAWRNTGVDDSIELVKIEDDTLPFEDNTFDVIVGFGIGSQIYDVQVFYSELERVLKRTGRIMLNFPVRTWKALFMKPLRHFLSAAEIRSGLKEGIFRSCRIASPRPGALIVTNLQRPQMPGGRRPGGPGRM